MFLESQKWLLAVNLLKYAKKECLCVLNADTMGGKNCVQLQFSVVLHAFHPSSSNLRAVAREVKVNGDIINK